MWMGAVFSAFSFFHAIGKNCRLQPIPSNHYGGMGFAGRRAGEDPLIFLSQRPTRNGEETEMGKSTTRVSMPHRVAGPSRSLPGRTYCTGRSDPPAHKAGDPLRAAGGACHHGHRSGQEEHPILQHFSALHLLKGCMEVKTGTFSDRIFLLKAHSLFSLMDTSAPSALWSERETWSARRSGICVCLYLWKYMRVLKKVYIIYTLFGESEFGESEFGESEAFASESKTSAGGEELRKVRKYSSQDTTRCS